ncbi:hypothetical protein, partial [Motilimonas pumila]
MQLFKMVAIAAFFLPFYSFANYTTINGEFPCSDGTGFCKQSTLEGLYKCHSDNKIVSSVVQCADFEERLEVTKQHYLGYSCSLGSVIQHHEFIYKQEWICKKAGHSDRLGSYSVTAALAPSSPSCLDSDYNDPYEINGFLECRIKTCDDGYYGDHTKIAGVCDRPTPTLPDTCLSTDITTNFSPDWPSCAPIEIEPEIPDTNCGTLLGNGWDTQFCIVDPNDACVNGICKTGCGTLNGQHVCFGDDLDADNDGFMDDSNNLGEGSNNPNDTNQNGCRSINGQSYCPQDPNDFINSDGSFPSGCGFVGDDFYCTTLESSNNPSDVDNPEFDNTPIDGQSGDNLLNSLITRLDLNNQQGFQNLATNIQSQTGDLLTSLSNLRKTIEDKPVSGVAHGGDSGTEPQPEDPPPDYTMPTSGDTGLFSSVIGDTQIAELKTTVSNKTDELKQQIQGFKTLFVLDNLSVNGAISNNIVSLRGASYNLNASAFDAFFDHGIHNIIWLITVITGAG